MPSAEGDRGILFTFLNRLPRLSLRIVRPENLSVLVIVLLLLSSFSFLAAFVQEDAQCGDVVGGWARSEAIVTYAFAISPRTAYVGQIVTFFANASSDLGSSLTFTIFYDYVLSNGSVNPYSPVSVNVTGNPGSIVTQFVYAAPGNLTGSQYQVRLSITDGTSSAPRNLTRVVTINLNNAPYFAPDLGSSLDAEIGVPLNMSVTCWDDDNDDLTLTWDFGDGTEPVVQTTGPSVMGVECNQTHTWSPDPAMWYGIGDTDITYYVNLSLTDGLNHWTNTTTLIRIPLDHNFSPKGNISVSSKMVDPADSVTIYGNASDVEGEPLTWTFVFNNSVEDFLVVVHRTGLTEPGAMVYQNTTYQFSEPGNYTVTLYLSDLALPELQVDPDYSAHNMSIGKVTISSVNNSIPYVLAYITVTPQDVRMNETTGVADALFSIQANDRDGEVLYATWDFGDGSEKISNVSLGGTRVYTFRQPHQFSASGQYNVSVMITDGRPGHEVLRYKLVNVSSNNSSPFVRDFVITLSNSSYGLPGSVVQFKLVLFDLERDPLEVMWDFGDGSAVEWTNVTFFDEDGLATCFINHTYSEVGRYGLLVNFTDGIYGLKGYHAESWAGLVVISIPPLVVVRQWDWWDYTSLGIFSLSTCLLVVWAVMGSVRRSRLDMMGTTMEEYLLRKQELEKYDERHKGQEGLR